MVNRKIKEEVTAERKAPSPARNGIKAILGIGAAAVVTAVAASNYFIRKEEKKEIEEKEFEEFIKEVQAEEEAL